MTNEKQCAAMYKTEEEAGVLGQTLEHSLSALMSQMRQAQSGNSSVCRIQQNRCVTPFLPEDEGISILRNVAIFKVSRFLKLFK
jgi:hypothetical protein